MNEGKEWTAARYRAAQAAGNTWPTRHCGFSDEEHRFHVWVDEPGDGWRYHYWCEGEAIG